MKKNVILVLILFLIVLVNPVFAQRGTSRGETINIRFGSTLPRNSDWGKALDRLAGDWQRAANNEVRVVVSHDGREGNESKMISSLSSNAIQAALFTTAGIMEICPDIMTLSIPFMIRDDEEFSLVEKNALPIIENRVDKNYVVIAWSKGGWVYVFSKDRIVTPEDMRRQKLATGQELTGMNAALTRMGFTLVEADMTTMGPMLASNRINALYFIPSAVAPMNLHRNLRHMLDMPVAPVMGAIVMNRNTWNRISPAHQQEIIKVTQNMITAFEATVAESNKKAILDMSKDGLNVNKPNKEQEGTWYELLRSTITSLIGVDFNRDIYNRMNEILEKSRSGQ
jgi:TRAP-type C4-dicarboxylate transport system substrate-binding protein